MIELHWPQWTWIALAAFSWLHELGKHGQQKSGLAAKHDIGVYTAGTGVAILLLWHGGFFG